MHKTSFRGSGGAYGRAESCQSGEAKERAKREGQEESGGTSATCCLFLFCLFVLVNLFSAARCLALAFTAAWLDGRRVCSPKPIFQSFP